MEFENVSSAKGEKGHFLHRGSVCPTILFGRTLSHHFPPVAAEGAVRGDGGRRDLPGVTAKWGSLESRSQPPSPPQHGNQQPPRIVATARDQTPRTDASEGARSPRRLRADPAGGLARGLLTAFSAPRLREGARGRRSPGSPAARTRHSTAARPPLPHRRVKVRERLSARRPDSGTEPAKGEARRGGEGRGGCSGGGAGRRARAAELTHPEVVPAQRLGAGGRARGHRRQGLRAHGGQWAPISTSPSLPLGRWLPSE